MDKCVTIITGASKGIGESIVKNLLSKSMNRVVLAARNSEQMKDIVSNCDPDSYLIAPTDVSKESDVKRLMELTYDKFNQINCLINNAGYVDPLGILETSLEEWNKTIATNLTGTFLTTREVIKFMKKTGGKIINVASTAGLTPRPGWCAYAASKAAVINLSMSQADELSSYGIKVFCIAPGRTATDLRKRLAPNEDPTSIMQPDAVFEVVKFLMSPNADTLEGQVLQVRERH